KTVNATKTSNGGAASNPYKQEKMDVKMMTMMIDSIPSPLSRRISFMLVGISPSSLKLVKLSDSVLYPTPASSFVESAGHVSFSQVSIWHRQYNDQSILQLNECVMEVSRSILTTEHPCFPAILKLRYSKNLTSLFIRQCKIGKHRLTNEHYTVRQHY